AQRGAPGRDRARAVLERALHHADLHEPGGGAVHAADRERVHAAVEGVAQYRRPGARRGVALYAQDRSADVALVVTYGRHVAAQHAEGLPVEVDAAADRGQADVFVVDPEQRVVVGAQREHADEVVVEAEAVAGPGEGVAPLHDDVVREPIRQHEVVVGRGRDRVEGGQRREGRVGRSQTRQRRFQGQHESRRAQALEKIAPRGRGFYLRG